MRMRSMQIKSQARLQKDTETTSLDKMELLQGVPKKMLFSGKTAITTFKLIQNAKVGDVLENSGYLLHHGH